MTSEPSSRQRSTAVSAGRVQRTPCRRVTMLFGHLTPAGPKTVALQGPALRDGELDHVMVELGPELVRGRGPARHHGLLAPRHRGKQEMVLVLGPIGRQIGPRQHRGDPPGAQRVFHRTDQLRVVATSYRAVGEQGVQRCLSIHTLTMRSTAGHSRYGRWVARPQVIREVRTVARGPD